MKNKIKLIISSLILSLFIISFLLISNVTSATVLYYGNFNLYLNQNNSFGSQLLEYYVAIQNLNATAINTTASILGRQRRIDVYESFLTFTANINGDIRILNNLEDYEHYFIRVSINDTSINDEQTSIENLDIFSFLNGDIIEIYFRITNPIISRTHINAIYGIVGIGLFCANPVLSYILTNKAKDKFHFFFILMAIGIISIGLMFSFIYG